MKFHKIKLDKRYCDDVLLENKSFEIRKNDRNYEVGDKIAFIPVENGAETEHKIQNALFIITYILPYANGLKEGYVAFTVRRF